jgi:hypothetical protein
MTRNVVLSLLRQGSNGEQILQILDTIVSGMDDSNCGATAAQPTSDPIEF